MEAEPIDKVFFKDNVFQKKLASDQNRINGFRTIMAE